MKVIVMVNTVNPISELLPSGALPIGLGCSRLGSINGATPREARYLLDRAFAEGVRFFDTSNIYGQGDSERLISAALEQREGCVICSKAGKYFDWKKRMLLPFKDGWRLIARRSGRTRAAIAGARAKPMPTCWEPDFLQASLEASLRRLRRERIEVFMLHSPDAETLRRGVAIETLERARSAGKIGVLGASVDEPDAAEAALTDQRIKVLQLPLRPGETSFNAVATKAAAAGVAVIAREILGGSGVVAAAANPVAHAQARLVETLRRPDVALSLIGTTKQAHLDAAIAVARRDPEGT